MWLNILVSPYAQWASRWLLSLLLWAVRQLNLMTPNV
jgi:hypothetical protein